MSSYLNIYLQDREKKEKHIIASYSRAGEVYVAIIDNIGVGYGGREQSYYTQVTTEDIDRAVGNVKEEVGKIEKRIQELEKHAAGNVDIINEIIETREWLAEKTALIPVLETYGVIARECGEDYSDFDGLYMNYD